jgi:hypothetical protein
MAAYFRLIIKRTESPNHLKHCSKQNTTKRIYKKWENLMKKVCNKKLYLPGVSKWELTGGTNINAYQFPGHTTGKRHNMALHTHMKTQLYSVFMMYSAQSVWDQLILISNLGLPWWWWPLVTNNTWIWNVYFWQHSFKQDMTYLMAWKITALYMNSSLLLFIAKQWHVTGPYRVLYTSSFLPRANTDDNDSKHDYRNQDMFSNSLKIHTQNITPLLTIWLCIICKKHKGLE